MTRVAMGRTCLARTLVKTVDHVKLAVQELKKIALLGQQLVENTVDRAIVN